MVYYVNKIFLHHGHYSGYQSLPKFIDQSRLFGDADGHIKLPALAKRLSIITERWYTKNALEIELSLMQHISTKSPTVIHHLYGENTFRVGGRINRFLGHRHKLAATYHQIPAFFQVREAQFQHLSSLDMAFLVNNNQRYFFEKFLPAGNIHVIPHGVDTSWFRPAETVSADPAQGALRCLTVGTNYRNFEIHLRIIASLNRIALASFEFIVVGEEYNRSLYAGFPNVRYLTNITDQELLHQYQSADLLLLPLKAFTASNALLESMACGLPIVATSPADINDYWNNTVGWLHNEEDVKHAVDCLIALSVNRVQLLEAGRAAHDYAKSTFAWPVIADKYRAIYKLFI